MVSVVSAGIATAQWLGLRLQLIAAVLVTLVGVMAIAGNEDILPGFHGAGEYTASEFAMSCNNRHPSGNITKPGLRTYDTAHWRVT